MAEPARQKVTGQIQQLPHVPPTQPDGQHAQPPKRKRAASAAPKNESKSDRFKRLGEKRVPRALKMIAAVENLGSKGSYEYTPEQAERIIQALTNAVTAVANKFAGHAATMSMFRL